MPCKGKSGYGKRGAEKGGGKKPKPYKGKKGK